MILDGPTINVSFYRQPVQLSFFIPDDEQQLFFDIMRGVYDERYNQSEADPFSPLPQ